MPAIVYLNADPQIAAYYDEKRERRHLLGLGKQLREQLNVDTALLLQLIDRPELMTSEAWIRESIMLRNTYVKPLHILQVELMKRVRHAAETVKDNIKRAVGNHRRYRRQHTQLLLSGRREWSSGIGCG